MTTSRPLVSSTAIHGLNWSLSDAWLLSIVAAPHVAPPSVERANQMRVLQVEATLVPGSFAGELHGATPGDAATPVRSVQIAYTMFFVAVR